MAVAERPPLTHTGQLREQLSDLQAQHEAELRLREEQHQQQLQQLLALVRIPFFSLCQLSRRHFAYIFILPAVLSPPPV